jgi:hypothetical protein
MMPCPSCPDRGAFGRGQYRPRRGRIVGPISRNRPIRVHGLKLVVSDRRKCRLFRRQRVECTEIWMAVSELTRFRQRLPDPFSALTAVRTPVETPFIALAGHRTRVRGLFKALRGHWTGRGKAFHALMEVRTSDEGPVKALAEIRTACERPIKALTGHRTRVRVPFNAVTSYRLLVGFRSRAMSRIAGRSE